MISKGTLIVLDSGGSDAEDIVFMFNPQEISFTRESQWQSDVGVRTSGSTGGNKTQEGPKVNFGGVQPYTFSLNKLIFDTYETKLSVLDEYIDNIKKGVATPIGTNTRPPVYTLIWGNYNYFPCVMTSLTYTLTMFLNDGTPVRALVDISLIEVDKGALSKKGKKELKDRTDDFDDRIEDRNDQKAISDENAKNQRLKDQEKIKKQDEVDLKRWGEQQQNNRQKQNF